MIVRQIDLIVMAVFSVLLSGVFFDLSHPGVAAAFGFIAALFLFVSLLNYLNKGE